MNLSRLKQNTVGASAIEFALLAPVFLTMIFGLIETSRAFWLNDAIEQAVFEGSRCAAIGDVRCETEALTQNLVVDRLERQSINVQASEVVVDLDTTCDGLQSMARVSVAIPFDSPLASFIPALPDDISTEACMPIV